MDIKRDIKYAQYQLGIEKLREHQVKPIKSILDGNDTMVIAPTSAGKSANETKRCSESNHCLTRGTKEPGNLQRGLDFPKYPRTRTPVTIVHQSENVEKSSFLSTTSGSSAP